MALTALLAISHASAVLLVAAPDPALQAREAVVAELRRALPAAGAVRLSQVGIFRQSAPNTLAVCGEVSPNGTAFAAVVITEESGARVQELHLAEGRSGPARTRAERWLRCTDETRRLDPGLRADLRPEPSPTAPARPHGPDAAPAGTAGPTVTMRQGGNLRSGPDGSSPVLRTLPRGTVARVFGEAQGGWYQVGDTAPWGWLHVTLLVAPPRREAEAPGG